MKIGNICFLFLSACQPATKATEAPEGPEQEQRSSQSFYAVTKWDFYQVTSQLEPVRPETRKVMHASCRDVRDTLITGGCQVYGPGVLAGSYPEWATQYEQLAGWACEADAERPDLQVNLQVRVVCRAFSP